MCGICGVVYSDGRPVDPGVLERMRDSMVHRGPDDAGSYVDRHVGLAMRRLSIIDLQTGHQPIFNEDRTVCVVLNGEIYNYIELREDLIARGHRFRTRTDTETIVHLYEEYGPQCVEHLNGMFGLAVWDEQKQLLLVARDRLGIKPLYVADLHGAFLFASELKALLEHPLVSRDVDRTAIAEYLTYEYIPAPRTVFEKIRKLPPATRLVWDRGTVREERYWQVSFERTGKPLGREAYAEAIREKLRDSVRLRLRSDVPLGVLLSGGLDSGSLAATMRALDVPIDTFSIGFQEHAYNELDAAEQVARELGTNHHSLQLTAADVERLLPAIIGFLDEPLADASVIPTFLVCQLARNHVKVALSGDGGDETLGGYETYKAHRLARYYRQIPRWVRSPFERAIRALPPSKSHHGIGFKANKFISGVRYPPAVANAIWWGAYTPDLKEQLLSHTFGQQQQLESFEAVKRVQQTFRGSDSLDRIFHSDLNMYLPDDLLVKVDRMSMAHSLEVRVPFLDHRFVEFTAGIPSTLKVRGLKLKHLFRHAMKPLLPPDILRRPKRGFDIPLDAWLRGPLREMTMDTLSETRLADSGYVRPAFVGRILEEHMSGRRNHRQLIWPLVVFELWRQRYL